MLRWMLAVLGNVQSESTCLGEKNQQQTIKHHQYSTKWAVFMASRVRNVGLSGHQRTVEAFVLACPGNCREDPERNKLKQANF